MTEKKAFSSPLVFILFICAGHFCVDFMVGIWPVFNTMEQLDLATAGFLASICVLFGEALQSVFGSLCDRGYQKGLLLLGICLATASSLFCHVAGSFAFFLLLLATCIGSAAFHPTAASLLGGLQSRYRSSIMGWFTASGMIGLGVSQMFFVTTHELFQGVTAVLMLPSLALACAIFFAFRFSQPPLQAKRSLFPYKLFWGFLKQKPLRTLYFIMIGNQLALWSLVFLLPDFLLSRLYPAWTVYGGGHFFLMLGATLGPPAAGYIADRTSLRKVMITLSCCTLLLFYLLLIPVSIPQALLYALLFAIGASLGSISPLTWSFGNQLAPQHRGVINAFLMGFVWIFSETLGIGLSGYLATTFTVDATACALACMGSGLVLASVYSFRLPQIAQTEDEILVSTTPIGEKSQ